MNRLIHEISRYPAQISVIQPADEQSSTGIELTFEEPAAVKKVQVLSDQQGGAIYLFTRDDGEYIIHADDGRIWKSNSNL